MSTPETPRPPLPPFTLETAKKKVRAAEDAWNNCATRNESGAGLHAEESRWRNRAEIFQGRAAIQGFLGAQVGQGA